jgi:hypothetical protein
VTQPTKYRKRPVEVEAIHYTGEFPLEFLSADEQVRAVFNGRPGQISIEARGRHPVYADLGYTLVREPNGTLTTYPDRALFEATYEPAPLEAEADV